MGHANIKITMDIYAEVSEEKKRFLMSKYHELNIEDIEDAIFGKQRIPERVSFFRLKNSERS